MREGSYAVSISPRAGAPCGYQQHDRMSAMDFESINKFTLRGLSQINVILGKNGCGKSYLLRQVERGIGQRTHVGKYRYISPERGGMMVYEASVEQAMTEPGWIMEQRRRNQSTNFRHQSAALFRRAEFLVLREIEKEQTNADYVPRNFDSTVDKLERELWVRRQYY